MVAESLKNLVLWNTMSLRGWLVLIKSPEVLTLWYFWNVLKGRKPKRKLAREGPWVCLWMAYSPGSRRVKWCYIWTQVCNISLLYFCCISQRGLSSSLSLSRSLSVFMKLVIRYEPAFLSYCMSPGCEWVRPNFPLTKRLKRNRNF